METDRFDRLIRALSSSRRGVLAGLISPLLATPPLGLSADEVQAKKKRKKNKRKKNKKATPASPPPASPPPSPPPPPVGAGRCDPVSPGGTTGARRFAQTFFPPRSGQLTAAEVVLVSNTADIDLTFAIFGVDAAGTPTESPLATALVNIAEATKFTDPPRTVSVAFALPVPLVLGQQLALAVTSPPDPNKGYTIRRNTGNPCPDGEMFVDSFATGDFFAQPGEDLVFALTIAD